MISGICVKCARHVCPYEREEWGEQTDRDKERLTETETDRDRKTDRQTERQTDRQKGRQSERQKHERRNRQTDIVREWQIYIERERTDGDRHSVGKADTETNMETD